MLHLGNKNNNCSTSDASNHLVLLIITCGYNYMMYEHRCMCACVHECGHMHQHIPMEVRIQLCGINSLILLLSHLLVPSSDISIFISVNIHQKSEELCRQNFTITHFYLTYLLLLLLADFFLTEKIIFMHFLKRKQLVMV